MTLDIRLTDSTGMPCVIWNGKADGADGGGVSFAVVGDHENRPTDMTNIVVYSFDPGADRYLGVVFKDVAKTLAQGTAPGFHDAVVICEEKDDSTL